jgi:hypothetical protein
MLPARLLIDVGAGDPRLVSVQMAETSEINRASRWRMPRALSAISRPTENQRELIAKASDNIEFSRLAAKRWKHYLTTGTAATSLKELLGLIANDSEGEFCFFLILSAPWFPGHILGEVMLRRTWCHHIYMDFLYQHPTISGGVAEVKKGVGYTLLISVAALARILQISMVWGEATKGSAPWYERQFKRPVKDHFSVEGALLRGLAEKFEAARQLAAEVPDDEPDQSAALDLRSRPSR